MLGATVKHNFFSVYVDFEFYHCSLVVSKVLQNKLASDSNQSNCKKLLGAAQYLCVSLSDNLHEPLTKWSTLQFF